DLAIRESFLKSFYPLLADPAVFRMISRGHALRQGRRGKQFGHLAPNEAAALRKADVLEPGHFRKQSQPAVRDLPPGHQIEYPEPGQSHEVSQAAVRDVGATGQVESFEFGQSGEMPQPLVRDLVTAPKG